MAWPAARAAPGLQLAPRQCSSEAPTGTYCQRSACVGRARGRSHLARMRSVALYMPAVGTMAARLKPDVCFTCSESSASMAGGSLFEKMSGADRSAAHPHPELPRAAARVQPGSCRRVKDHLQVLPACCPRLQAKCGCFRTHADQARIATQPIQTPQLRNYSTRSCWAGAQESAAHTGHTGAGHPWGLLAS